MFKTNLQLKTLQQNILELKKLIVEREKLIVEQENIIKSLKEKIHHR